MNSTWLVVALACERYLVLFYPFRAKHWLGGRTTYVIIALVFFFSVVWTLPSFFNTAVYSCDLPDLSTTNGDEARTPVSLYEILSVWRLTHPLGAAIRLFVRWLWQLVAVFLPLGCLLFCNVRLVRELRRIPAARRQRCPGQKVKDANRRITATLVAIVCSALALTTPSELIKFIDPYGRWGPAGYLIADITNLAQALNFALNFVLYCAVDATFRQVFRDVFSYKRAASCGLSSNGSLRGVDGGRGSASGAGGGGASAVWSRRLVNECHETSTASTLQHQQRISLRENAYT